MCGMSPAWEAVLLNQADVDFRVRLRTTYEAFDCVRPVNRSIQRHIHRSRCLVERRRRVHQRNYLRFSFNRRRNYADDYSNTSKQSAFYLASNVVLYTSNSSNEASPSKSVVNVRKRELFYMCSRFKQDKKRKSIRFSKYQ